MAGELTVGISLRLVAPLVVASIAEAIDLTRVIDIADPRIVKATQVIGTMLEEFKMVDVTSPRFIVLQNLDPTNYVQVWPAIGGVPLIRMRPGDPSFFPPDATTLFMQANTAACLVSILVVNS